MTIDKNIIKINIEDTNDVSSIFVDFEKKYLLPNVNLENEEIDEDDYFLSITEIIREDLYDFETKEQLEEYLITEYHEINGLLSIINKPILWIIMCDILYNCDDIIFFSKPDSSEEKLSNDFLEFNTILSIPLDVDNILILLKYLKGLVIELNVTRDYSVFFNGNFKKKVNQNITDYMSKKYCKNFNSSTLVKNLLLNDFITTINNMITILNDLITRYDFNKRLCYLILINPILPLYSSTGLIARNINKENNILAHQNFFNYVINYVL